jgi:UDP-perosamine 4-acetyltransferase
VVLIGAGGHARVCLESLRDCGHHVVGAISLDGRGVDNLGVEMLGSDHDIQAVVQQHQIDAAFPSIGDNASRSAAVRRCADAGIAMVAAISRYAMVSSSAIVCDGAVLMPGAVVNAASVIGTGAIVNTNASVDHDCDIGDFVHIAPGVALAGGIVVGESALIGIGARVLPNLTIGAGAIIGAGAVITRDVLAGCTVVGVPGRVIAEPQQ